MSVSFSIRLPDDTAKVLDDFARTTGRPRTYLILKAVSTYLAESADYQVALDRLRDKDDPVMPAAVLRKRLGRSGILARDQPRPRVPPGRRNHNWLSR